MRNSNEIKVLAYERLSEAQILCNNGKYDGAFYLAGYSIELMLKAKICELWNIDSLFDKEYQLQGIADVRRAIQTHNLAVLFIFSGLKAKFEIAKSDNVKLQKINNRLFISSMWSEQVRYLPIGSQSKEDTEVFIDLLKDAEGLLEWIASN